jgi:hypothetical protein
VLELVIKIAIDQIDTAFVELAQKIFLVLLYLPQILNP